MVGLRERLRDMVKTLQDTHLQQLDWSQTMQQPQKAHARTQQWGDKGGEHVPVGVTKKWSVEPFCWMAGP